ncbi:MAG: hypothetical protein MJ247_03055 [Alphaproteobacteria bacterium]|nr:hypothetical protein [Alphaproteobacteria bacterium]
MIINVTVIASHYKFVNNSKNLPEDSFSFTFMYQDLKRATRHDIIKIQEVLDSYNSDIVLWTNVPADVYREINNFKGNYALQNQTYDTKGKMQLILSKTPGTNRGLIGDNNGIWVSRIVGERKLSIVLTSQNSPWKSKDHYFQASNNINELAYFAKTRDEPVVIFGGFGASAWSKLLRPLETKAELSTSGFTILYAENLYQLLTKRIVNSIFVHPGIAVSEIMKLPTIGKTKPGIAGTIKVAPIRKEIQFLELDQTVSEEYLLQQSN